jgi:O-methyltransferase
LWQLVAEASKLPAGDLIEIGVWRGGTGGLIAARCAELALNSQVYLCDTFKGVVKAGGGDGVYGGGEHSDTSIPIVSDLMRKLMVSNATILEGIFPDATSHLISQQAFRFCHIDVDVYQSAKDCMEWLWPRLLPGGIIVYDDYGFQRCEGVTRCVNEQRGCSDRTIIHNLNGHAVVIKTS